MLTVCRQAGFAISRKNKGNQQRDETRLSDGEAPEIELAPSLPEMFPFGGRILCRPVNQLVVQRPVAADGDPRTGQKETKRSQGPVLHAGAGRTQPKQTDQKRDQSNHHQRYCRVCERGNDPLHGGDVAGGVLMIERRHQAKLNTEREASQQTNGGHVHEVRHLRGQCFQLSCCVFCHALNFGEARRCNNHGKP